MYSNDLLHSLNLQHSSHPAISPLHRRRAENKEKNVPRRKDTTWILPPTESARLLAQTFSAPALVSLSLNKSQSYPPHPCPVPHPTLPMHAHDSRSAATL